MNALDTIDRLMRRLRRPCKEISGCEAYEGGKTPFLRRYVLGRIGGGHLYLHCFLRSDEGDDLHDHPWHFVSLILLGGYVEVTESGRRRRRPGAVLLRPAAYRHRVELLPACPECNPGCLLCQGDGPRAERPSVSLVWVSGRKREWGFWSVRGDWTPWRAYFAALGCDDTTPGQNASISVDQYIDIPAGEEGESGAAAHVTD